MTTAQWSFKTAVELSAALAAKKVSAVELAQDTIGRIERHDRKINAICVRDFARGLDSARAADAARARGEIRPLLGIPMTVKESYNVAGLPHDLGLSGAKGFHCRRKTRWRFPASRPPAPSSSARPTCRSGSATGRATTISTAPPTIRTTSAARPAVPPADRRRRLRPGYGPLSLGSDIGGSLRVPAFHCGIYAHKPTFALVPSRGHYAAAISAAAVRSRSRGDRTDGALGRRPFAAARRDRGAGPGGNRHRLYAGAAGAASE